MSDNKNRVTLLTEGVKTVSNEGFATNGKQSSRMTFDGISTKTTGQLKPKMTPSFVSPPAPSFGPKKNK